MTNGNQVTISSHVDVFEASHEGSKSIDELVEWVCKTFGTIVKVWETHGKIHLYHGMRLGYTQKGEVKIDIVDYVKSMVISYAEHELPGTKV